MERFITTVDQINTAIGKTAGWCILILTLTTSYEVFSRYLFGSPTDWAFDASYILYGALFMLAGAYTLARNSHVRGDFIYRAWTPRTQAKWDLVLFILFFFPGMLAFIYSGYGFAKLAWLMGERSSASPNGPIIWPFKWLIPIVGVMMVTQGVVEVIRCMQCIKTGEWPSRLHDVEELDKVMLEKAAHGEYEVVKELEEIGQRRGAI
jgi:TRAP-type mannitol/chloroaromatic compound transport system permease small subunit